MGAVLSQVIDGHEWAVAYASRALTKPERWYCTARQEMLALVLAAQHFRAYTFMNGHFKQELIISRLSG